MLFSLRSPHAEPPDALGRRLESEIAARVEAEHRARLEQEALLRAEDARFRAEAATRREEVARIDAIREGAAEQARLRAEQEARVALLVQAQQHERALAALDRMHDKRAMERTVGIAIVFVLVACGALATLYFGWFRPEVERLRREVALMTAVREGRPAVAPPRPAAAAPR
jgi:hypothetical protein